MLSSYNNGMLQNMNDSLSNNIENANDDTLNPVKVYAWFASIPTLCKSIWLMAVAQHQFFLDKKQTRDNISQFISLNDLAQELNNTTIKTIGVNYSDEFHSKSKDINIEKTGMSRLG